MQTRGSLSRVSQSLFRLSFDELPDSAVECILRFLGTNPRQGIHQVPGKIALSLSETRGSLRRLSRNFLSLAVYKSLRSGDSGDSGDSVCSVCLHPGGLRNLPKSFVLDLRSLHVRSDTRYCFDDILAGCAGLRSFSYEQHFKSSSYRRVSITSMIAAIGLRLEHLHLTRIDDAVVTAIALHCKNLRHLNLVFGNVCYPISLGTMWQNLGTKLEHLEIASDFSLGALALHCPNVSHLAIDPQWQKLDTEEVCVSFGRSLLNLKLSNCYIESEGLARISEACPTAVIDSIGDNDFGMLTWEALALGQSAASWKVSVSCFNMHFFFCAGSYIAFGAYRRLGYFASFASHANEPASDSVCSETAHLVHSLRHSFVFRHRTH